MLLTVGFYHLFNMKKKLRASILISSMVLIVALLTGCNEESMPNVLFIMTDQQSLNTIGAYGSKVCRTPSLDSIAGSGMIFMQCHLASYPCSPSRASILSGRYSHNHGVVTNNIPLDENMPLMGQLLKDEGYATSYFGKSHLGGFMHRNIPSSSTRTKTAEWDRPWEGNWGYVRIDNQENPDITETDYFKELADGHKYVARQGWTGEDEACFGFDHWIGGWKQYRDFLRENGYDSIVEVSHHLGAHGTVFAPRKDQGFGDSWHAYSIFPEEMHQEAFFVNEAIAYLDELWDREQPFGMFLSFFGPHHPLLPPRPWDDMYAMEDVLLPATIEDSRMIGGAGTYRRDDWSDEQFRDYIRRYWGFTSFIDSRIGLLMHKLEEMGELDNTIIIFTSDHGDMAGEHGSIYKSTLCSWDELMRVPLIVAGPGVMEKGSRSDALVSNIDFLPTLLELVGAEIPASIDGESFAPVLRDPEREHREVLFTSVMGLNFMGTTEDYKYNMNITEDIEDELYDRRADPDEMNNLINNPDYAGVAEDMKAGILGWLKESGHSYAEEIAGRTGE